MKQTIFTILTDPEARSQSAVESSLDQEFTAGAPWFDKAVVVDPAPSAAASQ